MNMKTYLPFIGLLLWLGGCAPKQSQLITLSSDTLKPSPQQGFVYDTDTLRLSYQFFSERGVIHLSIENKLDKPLYVDWKRSAFITGNTKLDYWYDVAAVNLYGTAYTSTYSRYLRNWNSSLTSISLDGTIRKENAIDFIPPGTKLEKDQFVIVPDRALPLPGQFRTETVTSTVPYRPKPVSVQTYQYTPNNSPLTFRNYVTLSTDKDFKHEIVLDSKFWASDVQVMPYQQLSAGRTWLGTDAVNETVLRASPYYRPDAFFVNYRLEE